MVTQISFTADKQLKDQALKKAKTDGIPLKSLFIFAMKGYIEGKMVMGLLPNEESDVEELFFDDKDIMAQAKQLQKLLS